MAQNNPLDDAVFRLRMILLIMLLCFGGLLAAMWKIQVSGGERYQEDLIRQSVRRVRLPGARGRIFDRNGHCLADNRPSYGIAIYMEELRRRGGSVDRAEMVVQRLSEVLGVPAQITRADITKHFTQTLPLPLLAWKHIDERVLARFSEYAAQVPGVDIEVQPLRSYPQGEIASHVLGYIGRPDKRRDPRREREGYYNFYLPEFVGRAGLELEMDEHLRGEAGGRLIRVDVSGYRHEDLGVRAPRSGSDIELALDLKIQRLAEKTLGDTPGSMVVLDPRNGDILAMANYPRFDGNDFVPFIPTKLWDRINNDEQKPLLNRAIGGSYPPGSIFKPVVALAALENDKATGDTQFTCPGYFDLGKSRFRCWTRGQHGSLTMREAIKHSCNVYFYRLGLLTQKDYIYHMAAALGLGTKSGVDLPGERSGLLPSAAWSRDTRGFGWRPGDTCNFSIGQGALTVTPLQMAIVTATIANGGHVYRPRLVKGIRPSHAKYFKPIPAEIINEMNWSRTSLRIIQEGMRDVVMDARGTGKMARIDGVSISGKTGTAEYGPKELGQKRGWMIAYAPSDQPRYAVAMVIDDAMSGGVTVAPRIKMLMESLFGVNKSEGGEG